jgi:SHS2 domain-containing protein
MPRGSSSFTTPVASSSLAFRFCDDERTYNNNNSPKGTPQALASGYRFLDHMTDAVIEAYGSTLEEAFENAAKALNDTMVDLKSVRPDREIRIDAMGHDLHELLFDWLDKVMLLLVADGIVMSEFAVKIKCDNNSSSSYSLKGVAKGEKLNLEKHPYKVEIKAVTYHEMQVRQDKDGATVRFLLDL